MDELCAAAATVAVVMDREDSGDLAVESMPSSSAAVDVLSSIDANRGGWCKPDPRSHFPSKSRGASRAHTVPSTLAIFGPGRGPVAASSVDLPHVFGCNFSGVIGML